MSRSHFNFSWIHFGLSLILEMERSSFLIKHVTPFHSPLTKYAFLT